MRRSNTTRAKPRAPAQPLASSLPSTPRNFQPPAYYAAAGGLISKLPTSPYFPPQELDLNSRMPARVQQRPPHTHTRPSASNSSLEDAAPLRKENHKPGKHAKPSSPAVGFPNIEAQLLPSLRDTIDRMTRYPQNYHSPSTIDPQAARFERRDNASSVAHLLPDKTSSTPNTPIADPGTSTKRSQKPPLKSSLRPPTAKIFQAQNSSEMPSNAKLPPLQTMRNLLTRKMSAKSLQDKHSSKKNAREASDHDDILFHHTPEPFEDSWTPPGRSSATDARRYDPQRQMKSQLPRPRAKPSASTRQHDDSDLEARYDNEIRGGRRLTVANAEVQISTSGSESGPDAQIARLPTKNHTSRSGSHQHPPERSVGLGLTMPNDHSKPIDHQYHHPSLYRRATHLQPSQEKTLRFSLPPSDSGDSTYSSDPQLPHEGHWVDENKGASWPERRHPYEHADRRPTPASNTLPLRMQSTPPLPQGQFRQASNIDNDTRLHVQSKANRRRSTSHSPRPHVSEEDSDYVPIVQPRSRSVCQQYQSPPAEQFPTHLRDLLAKRNSVKPLGLHPPSPSNDDASECTYIRGQSRSPDGYRSSGSYKPVPPVRGRRRSPSPPSQHSVAARERKAFGLPPSESEEIRRRAERSGRRSSTRHSDVSDEGEDDELWNSDLEEDEFGRVRRGRRSPSFAKESRLHQPSRRHDTSRPVTEPPRVPKSLKSQGETSYRRSSRQRPSPIPDPQSYDEMPLDPSRLCEEQPTSIRRQNDVYPIYPDAVEPPKTSHNSIEPCAAQPPPPAPLTREGVIQEIFDTEEQLIYLIQLCIRTFILPLRIQNTRVWIAGIPTTITRLLDWFDDIGQLHQQIYDALCSARDTQSPTTERIAESLRCFVLKIEVYQPYLVRVDDVSLEILECLKDEESEFGQFVLLQQESPQCEGWALVDLLGLPARRLGAYQDLFSRMLDYTPKTHQDYLSTFSLSRATDMVVRIMAEVKIREHEYQLVKLFASRMQGLAASSHLPNRERRLLHSGALGLLQSDPASTSGDVETAMHTPHVTIDKSAIEHIADIMPVPSKSSWFSKLPLRRKRSRAKLCAIPSAPARPDEDPTGHCAVDPHSVASTTPVSVQAFVFSDLILLARSLPSKSSAKEPKWILHQDCGLFRPLSISKLVRHSKEQATISLEALGVDPNNLNDASEFRSMPFLNVDLSLCLSPANDSDGVRLSSDDILQRWVLAIRQCTQSTIKKLSFPSHQDAMYHGSDEVLDTHRALSSLLGSGLPLPRSPSGQRAGVWSPEADCSSGALASPGTMRGDEREERGWWSLRYQQVFREFQRHDLMSDDEEPPA